MLSKTNQVYAKSSSDINILIAHRTWSFVLTIKEATQAKAWWNCNCIYKITFHYRLLWFISLWFNVKHFGFIVTLQLLMSELVLSVLIVNLLIHYTMQFSQTKTIAILSITLTMNLSAIYPEETSILCDKLLFNVPLLVTPACFAGAHYTIGTNGVTIYVMVTMRLDTNEISTTLLGGWEIKITRQASDCNWCLKMYLLDSYNHL